MWSLWRCCGWGMVADGESQVQNASLQEHPEPKVTEGLGKVTQASPKGCIKAVQAEVVCSPSVGVDEVELDSQTTWIAVADVSFADMLCSVERDCNRESHAACPKAAAAGLSSRVEVPQVEFPRLRDHACDTTEAELPASMWKAHSLATVREESPSKSARACKAAKGAAKPVFNITAASNEMSLRETYAAAVGTASTPQLPGPSHA